MKLYEDQQRRQGQPIEYAFAKQVLASVAGTEAENLAESRGLDEREKRQASKLAIEQVGKLWETRNREPGGGEYGGLGSGGGDMGGGSAEQVGYGGGPKRREGAFRRWLDE
jgi:hypothetical protein